MILWISAKAVGVHILCAVGSPPYHLIEEWNGDITLLPKGSLRGFGVGYSMAQDFARQFYYSKAWKDCKRAFISNRISEDGGMCQICHEQPGYIVHHRVILTPENITNAEITLNTDNLEFVCHDCHNKIHFVERYNLDYGGFDEHGQPIQKR